MPYDDEVLLKLVGEERQRSIGFGEANSYELTSARQTALAFAKGDMINVPGEHKVPSLPNRSRAVDTAVADAIETVLPDVMEIFVGGDDIATFIPQSEDDEEAAQKETDFVTDVVMTQNEGFLNLYTAIKDALLTRTGILHWWWEEESRDEVAHQLPAEQASMAPLGVELGAQAGQELTPEEQDDGSVNLMRSMLHGKVCIKAFPSEDFTTAPDTVSLRDATYCAVRERTRVQDLIARGIDPEKASALPSYLHRNEALDQTRDEAGEHDVPQDGSSDDLRIVEVRAHYIRLASDDDPKKLTVWMVMTDSEERVLLDKSEVGSINFAALTPYIVPHRFYGESVADKLIEVQKIKTVLLRMFLDNGYFALNQRMEVAEAGSNDYTIADLLRNEPGVPIRVKTAGTVTPIQAGSLNFDPLAAIEYVNTMAEGRSGIVRNAQGLNPDTLHDTMGGAAMLISAAQKRVRFIARVFAETGIKDLLVGVHETYRTNYTPEHAPAEAKLRNKWTQLDPSQWPERRAMRVGIGSSGKEREFQIATQRLELMERLIMVPGAQGMLIDQNNIHNALEDWERAGGSKNADLYWSDPASKPPQPPKPDPEMAKAQGDLQLRQAQASSDAQLAQAKAQSDAQLQAAKHQNDMQAQEAQAQRNHELQLAQISANAELKRYQVERELQLEREKLAAQIQTQRELGMLKIQHERELGEMKVNAQVDQVKTGGEPG